MSLTVTATTSEPSSKKIKLDHIASVLQSCLTEGIPSKLPAPQKRDPSVPHAPRRPIKLSAEEKKVRRIDKKKHLNQTHFVRNIVGS